MDVLTAAGEMRKLAAIFEGAVTAAIALEKLGSFEQAVKEAQKRAADAQAAADAAIAKAKEAKAEVARIYAEADARCKAADEHVKKATEDAKKNAAEVVKKASEAILAAETAHSERAGAIEKQHADKLRLAGTHIAKLKATEDELTDSIEKGRSELAGIEERIKKAREAAAKILG